MGRGVFSCTLAPSYPHALLLLLLLLLTLATGCRYYSFTGASIPEGTDTVAIPLAENNSVSPLTTLDESLTQLLVDRFVGQTRLRLEPDEAEADVILATQINRYVNEPTAVTGEERASLNRVTITVAVRYFAPGGDAPLLERTFSGYEEYDPAQGLEQEEAAAQAALEDLADDIFTAATSNW